MSNKILITGGTGFLGAYIIRQLVQKGYAVRALCRRPTLPAFIDTAVFAGVEWVEGDILDVVSLEEAMEGIDTVIHAAAIVSFDGDKAAMYRINIEGTANVVNMALEKNVRRFIHISSVAALGRTKNGDTVTEEKKWQDSNMNTPYAISKYYAEREVWRGMGEGLEVVVLNPSTIIGYGNWNNSSSAIFKTVYNEFPWYTTGVNGFVGVEDVAAATVLLMESGIKNERFIVNGENWSFQQLFNTIAKALGKKPPSRVATLFLGAIAWRLEKVKALFTGQKPLLTRQTARLAQSETYFNNEKLLKALPGFSFTPLTQVIENACISYLADITTPELAK